ncbi:MAG: hypothetical protein IT427_18030 [Pirellulales bacterium]|nr:hypothetical protein [Pirellulales bacterium]
MLVEIFGPIRPSSEITQESTIRVRKSHNSGQDFFTDITLRESRGRSGMRVEFGVSGNCQNTAERAGTVYLGHLCDLISAVTRVPIWFYLLNEDAREERMRMNQIVTSLVRDLSQLEWHWITGNLVFLQQEHPRFLAAASWYRKGLLGNDSLDDFCCFWRVIERLASTYADRARLTDANLRQHIEQLMADLSGKISIPEILRQPQTVSKLFSMRNNLSHGNEPITPALIEETEAYLKPLEDAAFAVLQGVRETQLECESAG